MVPTYRRAPPTAAPSAAAIGMGAGNLRVLQLAAALVAGAATAAGAGHVVSLSMSRHAALGVPAALRHD